jgi:hypothetical protein
MPVPASNQGAESKRWLVPLLANTVHLREARIVAKAIARASRP